MKDHIEADKADISAMLDGELSADLIKPTLEKIKNNPELRAYWRDMHAVRDALTNSKRVDWLAREIQLHSDKTKIALSKPIRIDVDAPCVKVDERKQTGK